MSECRPRPSRPRRDSACGRGVPPRRSLWASLRAFGGSCSVLTLVMAYLAWHAFNVLPVPGGVGPVEGGIIAALVAFGQPAGLAVGRRPV